MSILPHPKSAAGTKPIEVAIVGAGPVGLTLAGLLRKQGVGVTVYERRAGLHRQPQAHVVNTRSMEVFRRLGIDRQVVAAAAPMAKLRAITWRESVAGREFGILSLMGGEADERMHRLSQSPATFVNIAQNVLEPLLYRRLVELGGDVKFGHTIVGVDQSQAGVCLEINADAGGEFAATADYILACDGAGSSVRRALSIEMVGPTSLQKLITVYFRANLDRYFRGSPGPVHWIVGPDIRGVLIGFDMSRVWALMTPYSEPDRPEDFTSDVVEQMVRKAIGDPDAEFEISSVCNWNMSAQVAQSYQSGRAFLAGDAAHRFPPSGGLGLNTGIQDAYNLAWKLCAVIKGHAPSTLLETYEQERRPIALINCEQSLCNSMRMGEVDAALGASSMSPVRPIDALHEVTPSPDLGLDGDHAEAVAKRAAVASAIDAQIEHFDSFGLDLGASYESGALSPDGTDAPPISVRRYDPSARPGARLPHVWLACGGKRVSTQDLVPDEGYLLITRGKLKNWRSAVAVASAEIGQPIRHVCIGPGADFEDPQGAWERVCGFDKEGALLVRPDGHIGWRALVKPKDPTVALVAALKSILRIRQGVSADRQLVSARETQ